MPPAAISRSSTYLPKIWGNTLGKSSAVFLALLVSGCGPDKEPDQVRSIRAYYACDGPGDPVEIQLDAVGDFEPSTRTREFVGDDAVGLELSFPAATRGVEAVAESGPEGWSGLGLVTDDPDVSLLLWPTAGGCALWKPKPAESAFPLDAVGTAIGYLPERRVLLLAGSAAGDPRAIVIDLGTGALEQMAGPNRAFASVTPFGESKLLVAGGIDPEQTVSPGDSALVFDAKKRAFEGQTIALKNDRSRHGSVVLANGDTLLVGGVTNKEADTLEVVSPKLPKDSAARVENLTSLSGPRVSPTVLRLSDDRIFVGGGRSGPNPSDAPVSALQWLSSDASTTVGNCEACGTIRVAPTHAFAALPGGAVLAVGLCVVVNAGDECDLDTDQRVSRSIAWIRHDQTIDALDQLLPSSVTSTRLVPASDGSPWLFAITEQPTQQIWLRFNPWLSSFEEPANAAPSTGPVPDEVSGESLAPPLPIDAGLFVWLEQTRDALGAHPSVVGFRFDTRNVFARQVGPLLAGDTEHVAPSIPPFPVGSASSKSQIGYDGLLTLSGDEAIVTVTDTTYADVRIEIERGVGSLPRVHFGDVVVGRSDCPWPDGIAEDSSLTIERRGSSLTVFRGGETRTCPVAPGRHHIALQAPEDGSKASIPKLEISRL